MFSKEPVNVSKNIDRIMQNIDDMKKRLEQHDKEKKEVQDEILRLEGCLIVFKGFREAGISEIQIPEEKTLEGGDDHEVNSIEFCDEIRCLRE